MSIESELAHFAVDTASTDIPEEARAAARVQVVDGIAVALASVADPMGEIITDVVTEWSGAPQATVIGTGLRTSTVHAAWANGVHTHLQDFDDIGFAHPTSPIYPAALAVAEHLGRSGREFLDAMVIGYDVMYRLMEAAKDDAPRIRNRGYHPTSIYGSIAATAAVGRLIGLTPEQLVYAFGLTAADTNGLTAHFGTPGKGVHAGNAARSAVQSTAMTSRGYWGASEGLFGRFGYFSALHGENYDASALTRDLGKTWSILHPGLGLKYYPICGGGRQAVEGTLEAVRKGGFGPDDVERVLVHVHPIVFDTMQYIAPKRGFQGKFSIDYLVAAALLDGDVTIDSFTDEAANRPELRAIIDRIEYVEHPEWDRAYKARKTPLEFRLRDGRVVEESVVVTLGSEERPMSQAQVEAKFIDCARRSLGEAAAEAALPVVWDMGSAASIGDVVAAVSANVQAAK